MPAKYPGLRALLRPCMEGVAAPFSDEGESVVSMRFHVAVQTALTEHLIGLNEGQSVKNKRPPSWGPKVGIPYAFTCSPFRRQAAGEVSTS